MDGGEESDGVVVPLSPSNKATEQQAEAAEREEGRTPTEENTSQTHTPPAQDAPRRFPGIGGCAQSGAGKEAGTVHHTAASRDGRSGAGEFSRTEKGSTYRKPTRRQRPIGIAALEDKIVQQAVGTILHAIYEVDFRGFSYGFRPGRSPHQALDALNVGIVRKRVNWILDADMRGFFAPDEPRMDDAVCPTPGRRQAHLTPDPEMAEGAR
jgi:RNA-directed DNA polymerase